MTYASTLAAIFAVAVVVMTGGGAQAKQVDESRLIKALWSVMHPGQTPPVCNHTDPLRTLTADVDPSPGVEVVLASRGYGVFVLTPDSRILGYMEIGCGDDRYVTDAHYPQVVSLSTLKATPWNPIDLVVRELDFGHCGEVGNLMVLRRVGMQLVPVFKVEDTVHLSCGANDEENRSAIVDAPAVGRLRVQQTGIVRKNLLNGEFGPPRRVSTRTEYRLVGGSFMPIR